MDGIFNETTMPSIGDTYYTLGTNEKHTNWFPVTTMSATAKQPAAASRSSRSRLLVYVYVGICALVLAGHAADVSFNIRSAPEDEVDGVISNVMRDHPAQVSASWASHEVLRLRKLSGWFDLHALAVFAWLLLSFVQLSTTIRKNMLWLHKWSGRLLLLTTIVMMVGVFGILANGETTYGTQFDVWTNPYTFSSWAVVGGTWWLYCGLQGYRHATKKTHSTHKYYMYHFLFNGYSPGTARLLIFAYFCYYYPKGSAVGIDVPEVNWLLDVTAWGCLISHTLAAEIAYRMAEGQKSKTA